MNTPFTPGLHPPGDAIDEHVNRIRASGVLARSTHLNRLFDFLYACHQTGRTPKEFEIAVDGLGRHDSFDVTQDALVRVYIHKLRRKLDEYYQDAGRDLGARLIVPKGEYRLLLADNGAEAAPTEAASEAETESRPTAPVQPRYLTRRNLIYTLAGVFGLSLLLNFFLIGAGAWDAVFTPERSVRHSELWQPLFADDKPVVIVVGDYYIFAEADAKERVRRLVRDFDINSPTDLASALQVNPGQAASKFDVGLSYLPTSAAYAINKVTNVFSGSKKKPWVILASELTPENVRNSHIVYVGHLSGLGMLEDLVFAHASFRLHGYDELIDTKSGQRYISSSGIPHDEGTGLNHLAYVSAFSGPTGNRIMVIAGCRDAGLREVSDVVSSPAGVKTLDRHHVGNALEALYQTAGFGLATTPAKLLTVRALPQPAL